MGKNDKGGKGEKASKHPKVAAKSKSDIESTTAHAVAADYPNFDIDDPKLPKAIEDKALASGGYPYDDTMKRKTYEAELEPLQIELLKLQSHIQSRGERVLVLFEGRDSSGKGGSINAILQHMKPRYARSVALTKPTETERGQWYFQRYVAELPARGDIVLFDRSWYNRAGVEPVMGFCTKDQQADFLRDAPTLESLLVRDGVHLFKFYLTVGREMQLMRFHERRHDPLKRWKLTDIDLQAIGKWDDYSTAEADMFRFTDTADCPWTVVNANDQRRARLAVIRVLLDAFDYEGKDAKIASKPDPKIVGTSADYLARMAG
ncbi:MAG: polyphosphate kinase 2 [Hyphomicrobium sp.]|nr:polyphosphate kinase 2 [Hyphomicrobium sp.]